jgi:outer membrane receptor for ferrienterochelin and colicins
MDEWIFRATVARSNPDRKLNFQGGLDFNVEGGDGKRILDEHQQIGDYAAFVSVKWDPLKVLSFQPGLRFIYNTKYAAPVVYALSGKWNILPTFSLRASYSRGFRAPSIKELYLNFVDINHNIQGNPDLKAERSNNLNITFNYGKEKTKTAWSAEATFFYNIIDNIITLAQNSTITNEYTYVNIDKFKTLGGQLGLTFDLYPSLKISAGLAETGRLNYLSGPENQQAADYFYTTDVTASATYRFVKPELSLMLNYKYTGKLPNIIVDNGTISEGYVGAYNMMDFSAMKSFWGNRIRLTAGVNNIFNVKTIPAVGVTGGAHSGGGESMNIGWGTTVFAKITLNINKLK